MLPPANTGYFKGRFHAAVLEALYALEQDGRNPSNEEDLEGQLGYSDGAGFRRDRPLIEAALADLQHREWVKIDPHYFFKLTPAGRHAAVLAHSEAASLPMPRTRRV